MKKKCFLAMGFMVLVVFFISVSAWAVPQLINYQGKVTDNLGNPLTGSCDMKFQIFDVASGGTPIWTEPQTVFVTDGIYNVQLGSVEPFPEGLFGYEYLYLEVMIYSIDGMKWETLSPRQRLISTAYSMKAGDTETLDGHASTDFLTSTQPGSMTVDTDLNVLNLENMGSGGGLIATTLGAHTSAVSAYATNTGESWSRAFWGRAEGKYGQALYGEASGTMGKGVYGNASNTGDVYNYGGYFEANGGQGTGVYGRASGTAGRGVYGIASATGAAENYGGYFEALGNMGYGVYGKGGYKGVWGDAFDDGAVQNYGGYFQASGVHGRGVYGIANGTAGRGVYGIAFAQGSNYENYGGYFEANGGNGVGVYAKSKYGKAVDALTSSESTNEWTPAIYGRNEGAGDGVYGWSQNRHGLVGISNSSAAAIWARNNSTGPAILAEGGSDGLAGDFRGKVKTSVLEITGGSDLSEQFEIRGIKEKLLPSSGMVVSIDPENPGDLVVSTKTYDRRVAGIISGAGGVKPGMLMGQEGSKANGANPVALTGRVYCWCDASNGTIQPGDLLTTSDIPGHAMKVSDYAKAQGAILGKAMEKLEKGEKGQILVLVTLQ